MYVSRWDGSIHTCDDLHCQVEWLSQICDLTLFTAARGALQAIQLGLQCICTAAAAQILPVGEHGQAVYIA